MNYFEPIRPYFDEEVQPVLAELLEEPTFRSALAFIFPGDKTEAAIDQIRQITSVNEFQAKIISQVVREIAKNSVTQLVANGFDIFKSGKPFLIVSNHRDIVLDSAFLNYVLFSKGFLTTRIAIGNNLLQKVWIEKLVRLNKNFIVHRDVQARQAHESALRVSAYIRKSILEDEQSVWIAQREGRSKDGRDFTQPGLLKMLSMSAKSGDHESFADLNILPLSISYELEPCAGLKAREMYLRQTTGNYTKAPGEDLMSMKSGLLQHKGEVTLSMGSPLNGDAIKDCFKTKSRNEGLRELASLIDTQIHSLYKLHPFNYIAADLLLNEQKYKAFYSEAQMQAFNQYIEMELSGMENKNDILPFLLNIYANPLFNKTAL